MNKEILITGQNQYGKSYACIELAKLLNNKSDEYSYIDFLCEYFKK